MGVRGFGYFFWDSRSPSAGSAARMTALAIGFFSSNDLGFLCVRFCLRGDAIFCSHSSLMSRCQFHIRVVRVDVKSRCSFIVKLIVAAARANSIRLLSARSVPESIRRPFWMNSLHLGLVLDVNQIIES